MDDSTIINQECGNQSNYESNLDSQKAIESQDCLLTNKHLATNDSITQSIEQCVSILFDNLVCLIRSALIVTINLQLRKSYF